MHWLPRVLCVVASMLAVDAWSATNPSATQLADRLQSELQALRARTDELQRELDELRRTAVSADAATPPAANRALVSAAPPMSVQSPGAEGEGRASEVDLTSQPLARLPDGLGPGEHVLERAWWNNVAVSGFAAAGFYDTGAAGTREHGGFEIKETTVFVEADVWSDVSVFLELQTNRLGADDAKFVRTGEVYLWLHNLGWFDSAPIGIKLGRIDLPFGEEYLTQDAIDNLLITTSAAYPYGWDEGVLVYGGTAAFGWIIALTDGTDTRSRDDNGEKAVNLKLHSRLGDAAYASLSYMRNGGTGESALEFGGSHLEPIGQVGPSSLGISASERVDAQLGQIDVQLDFRPLDLPAALALNYGMAELDDEDARFDRGLRWYAIEPYLQLGPAWYLAFRFSEIATDDDDEGFHFDGKTFAGGNTSFGDDANRFRRWAAGLGWRPNSRVRAKLEVGADAYRLIDASTFRPRNTDRRFVGLEVAVGF